MGNEQQVREGRKLVKKLVLEIFNGQPGDWPRKLSSCIKQRCFPVHTERKRLQRIVFPREPRRLQGP